MAPDFSTIQETIKQAARQAFTEVRSREPAEDFYAFALYSDDDGMTVMPSANVKSHPAPSPYHRWGCSEWKYCGDGGEYFVSVPSRGGDIVFRGKLYAAMVLALKGLDAEGFFGTGDARQQVTLLCSVTDSADAAWIELESARLLNPPAVYEAYLADVAQIDGFVENAKESWDDPASVYRHFHAALKQAGLPVPRLRLAAKPKLRATLAGHQWCAVSAAVSADGKLLATGAHQDRTLKIWDLGTCKERATLVLPDKVHALAFSPDGKILASGSGKFVQLWETAGFTELSKFEAHNGWINSLAFTPDGTKLVSGGAVGLILCHLNLAGAPTNKVLDASSTFSSVAVAPDGRMLATAHFSKKDSIKLWDLASGEVVKTLPTTEDHGTSWVIFTPDGQTLAAGGFAPDVTLWDVASGQLKGVLKTGDWGELPNSGGDISRDGRFLVAGQETTAKLRLWSLADGQQQISWQGDDAAVHFALFTPDGGTVISSQLLPAHITLWDVSPWTQG